MMARPTQRLLYMAAALCVLLGGQRSASATCGDYLSHSQPSVVQVPQLPSERPYAPLAPCRGPSCERSRPEAPLPGAPIRIVFRGQDLACLDSTPACTGDRVSWLAAQQGQTLVATVAGRLFRPPRLAL